ncbi:MAG: bifunctional phosphoribosylaminoimidazolecarboxamide formyltransferase/IMP cyclohydrolase [Alphaproteobacteria bacterium]|nr:bifunctional phosphoribosylaminoimidazolecarboxamide formyltransferase/IMP cyclohydrolase [Alphaproteobacteria bacterium]
MTERIQPKRALLSVSDKTGVVELAKTLVEQYQLQLLSTGGTVKLLRAAGIPATSVEQLTGFPEILDGRVKTLHPLVHAGILFRRGLAEDETELEQIGGLPIDLVVVNLYPFVETVESGKGFAEVVEKIDIGGPSMIRAAAKNFPFVTVLSDPAHYSEFLAALERGGTSQTERLDWAQQAFTHCGAYDGMIAAWLQRQIDAPLSRQLSLGSPLGKRLRYGENPHQSASYYPNFLATPGVGQAEQLQGKELSYNNLVDGDAAWALVTEIAAPAVVIVKHATPCGVGTAAHLLQAWNLALAADPISAFGGIIALNRVVDAATAAELVKIFSEVILAPDFLPEARTILSSKKNLRLLAIGANDVHLGSPAIAHPWQVKSLSDGYLVQTLDGDSVDPNQWQIVSERPPTPAELSDLSLAWTVAKHAKSNAIVLVKNGMTVGIGSGQTSRLAAAQQAIATAANLAAAAGEEASRALGAVAASDGFFPFADGLEICLKSGVTAAVEPGGAQRDAEVIACADRYHAALAFTGMRHFRHG